MDETLGTSVSKELREILTHPGLTAGKREQTEPAGLVDDPFPLIRAQFPLLLKRPWRVVQPINILAHPAAQIAAARHFKVVVNCGKRITAFENPVRYPTVCAQYPLIYAGYIHGLRSLIPLRRPSSE